MSAPALIDTAVHVEIPEDVRLRFRLAGPGPRVAAYLADLVLRLALLWGLLMFVAVAFPLAAAGFSWGLFLLALFAVEWGYGALFEGFWHGQTPGKHLFGLRVVKEGGHGIDLYDALLRNLLRAADALPAFYAAGLLTMALTPRLQRLGDLAAGTMVVHEGRERLRREIPELEGVAPLRRDELGSSWRPPERTLDLIHAFALRRAHLDPLRAREVARLLAEPLARRLGCESADARVQPDVFLLRVYRTFQARP